MILFIISLLAFSCENHPMGSKRSPETGNPRSKQIFPQPFDWPTADPEEHGMSSWHLNRIARDASEKPYFSGILVVRNEHLLMEAYFNNKTVDMPDIIASATKSYTSALVGLAIKEGYINSLDQKMMDFFPEYASPELDPRKQNITLRHLLTMRAGYPDDVYGTHPEVHSAWRESEDWYRHTVECPLATDPGTTWAYSNQSVHILGGIISKASGMSITAFAQTTLFDPLGITPYRWDRDSSGREITAWGLHMNERDMARFGNCFLNLGAIDGRQIIPEEWIMESTRVHSPVVGYGYLWWNGWMQNRPVYYARGAGGSKIIMNVPDLSMTIVISVDSGPYGQSGDMERGVTFGFCTRIIAAAWDEPAPPPYPPVNVSCRRVENRSLIQRENIDMVRWESNPRNDGLNIASYRIYRRKDDRKWRLAEIDAGTFEYRVRDASWNPHQYKYGVTAVTEEDDESYPGMTEIEN